MFPGLSAPPERLLVVVAHPDDETFGCGSLLLAAAAAGTRTAVLCATRGEAGEVAPGADLGGRSLGEAREAELREAARLLGVADVELLGHVDSGMSGPPVTGTLAAADPAGLVEAVRRCAGRLRADVLVTLDGSDGHRDHAVARDATLAAGARLGLPVYLSCLPRSLMRRWVAEMAVAGPQTEHLDAEEDRLAELGTPDELLTVVPAAEHLPARLRAIAAHVSQRSPFEALSPGLRRDFLADVHLRRAG